MSESHAVSLRETIEATIREHNRAATVAAVLSAVRTGDVSIDSLYRDVLIPLLVDTGTRWQTGTVRVWEEHLTSSIVRSVIESLAVDVAREAERVPQLGRTAVLACPTGEQHDMGLRMLADRLALRGWTVHYLGADTPAEEIVAAAKALGAEVVALSAATHYNLVLLRSFVDIVRTGLPGVRIGVGGPAFACDHSWPEEDLAVMHELGVDDAIAGSCPLPEADG